MSSIDYYDANAVAFSADTLDADVSETRDWFLSQVPAGGAVLEAGCGAGRDAVAFLRAGYRVTAFDGAAAMVRLASEATGLEVLHMTFADVAWDSQFDGVWACASLLHLSRAELPEGIGRLARALKPGGVLFASFKFGEAERHANGRRFTDLTQQTLSDLLAGAGLELVGVRVTPDGRPGRDHELWTCAIARRPA